MCWTVVLGSVTGREEDGGLLLFTGKSLCAKVSCLLIYQGGV